MKLGFSLAFKYKTPKPKPTSFFIGFPFLVFWVPVILHGGKKKIQSWARVLVSTLILAKKPEVHFLFFKMNFSESFFFHDYKFISGYFFIFWYLLWDFFFFVVCVNCRSFVQGLSERPQVHYHYLLSDWSCKFYLLLLLFYIHLLPKDCNLLHSLLCFCLGIVITVVGFNSFA